MFALAITGGVRWDAPVQEEFLNARFSSHSEGWRFVPEFVQPLVRGQEAEHEARLLALRRAGLDEAMVNPLHQMHWAVTDRRMALFAGRGLAVVLLLTCFVPLLRGKVTHEAANAMQWVMPSRDPFVAAGGALLVTVATAVGFLLAGPRPRFLPPGIEPDLYFYAPLAALFLLLCFTFTAALHARRGRCLGWSGRAWLWAIPTVPIAIFALWAQFAWRGTSRLPQVNLSFAGCFGLVVMSALLCFLLGGHHRSLERTVLVKQLVKTLVAACLLMSATAGACYLHELHWGRQDRLLGDRHGRPEIFRLRDELRRQSRAFQQDALDFTNP